MHPPHLQQKRKEVNSVVVRLPKGSLLSRGCPKRCPRFVILEGGASTIAKQVHELNEDILDKEIRLIGAEGQQLGIMSSQEARRSRMSRDWTL